MIPAAFEYTRAGSLDEAIAAVRGGAKVIAGGQSILPLLKLRLASVDRLVDIGRIAELRGFRPQADGSLEIGALTTYAEWRAATTYPGVREAIDQIADVQVRHLGTVGGAIAHADPASDFPAIALAFDGSAVLRGPGGERVVPLDGFFEGAFVSGIRDDEILVAIRRPAVPAGAGFGYAKLAQPASGYSIVGVAAVIAKSGGSISHARIGVTGVHEHPYRATDVEAALVGSDASGKAIAAAAAHATDGVEVNSDIHADATYRAAMAVVYAGRAIEAALARAG
ncbi:MAG: xanthine dehydrogenase family protein subunit M [Chloroflexota bacterium]